ncbi:hypothetical protein BdWA1_001459 [Babesia duncani]|uniref:Uncharacterized protein n=1 Tax=Babesia duncani TaxID=323732 RepID=A0AAD9UR26_9APIC|nr:hypothetical protein BdWA1_001459 [Babesia duncani]
MVYSLQRYMSTYWKILWEANENAKNSHLQLGRKYKILCHLYPRQLEALLTLEHVANECLLFSDDGRRNQRKALQDEQTPQETILNDCGASTPQKSFSTTISPTSSYSRSISRYTFQGEFGSLSSTSMQYARNYGSVIELIDEPIRHAQRDSPYHSNSSFRNSSLPLDYSSLGQNRKHQSSYIPKLHLKFSELRNVLSDKNVHFFLSGTSTNYDLCKIFASISSNKTLYTRFGASEVHFELTGIDPKTRHAQLEHLYKLGVENTYQDIHFSGHYIGTPCNGQDIKIVKTIDPKSNDYMQECNPGEPGYIVAKMERPDAVIADTVPVELNFYLGMDDIGFYLLESNHEVENGHPQEEQQNHLEPTTKHYYFMYKRDLSLDSSEPYPYVPLLKTSKVIQESICTRYGLLSPVVRVETVQIRRVQSECLIIAAVELVTSLKAEITRDIRTNFLDICSRLPRGKMHSESVGLFKECLEPHQIKVIAFPWAYKGIVNYASLRAMLTGG